MIRIDYLFSYWIYFWYIAYLNGITKYNPKFALMLGIIENIFILTLMFYYKTDKTIILLFTLMMIILKFIPLYSIYNNIISYQDIIVTIILFLIYLFWIKINNYDINNIINETKNMILYNKKTTPGIFLFSKFLSLFK
jgi:hypothetical protein